MKIWQDLITMKKTIRDLLDFAIKFRLSRFYKTRKSNRIDGRIENLIIEELTRVEASEELEEVSSKELLLNTVNYTTYTLSESLKMLSRILQTRGRLRWLCFRLLPTLFYDSYDLTRLKLLSRILKNWNLFVSTILSKLVVTEEVVSDYKVLDIYEFTHPNLKFSLVRGKPYILGKEISQAIDFSENSSSRNFQPKDHLLGRLILWNSAKTMNFVRESLFLSTNNDVLDFLDHFPSFINEMDNYSKFSIDFHENAELSFDDRLELNLKFPDVLKNVEIWNQRFLVSDNKWHIVDSTYSPYSKFVAGHWQFLEQIPSHVGHVYLKKPTSKRAREFTKAILLIGRADENWYHLLLDTLPRYLSLKTLDRDIPILVRDDLPETSIALIEKLTDREIIYVRPEDRIFVKTLYFIAARSTVHDSKPHNGEEQVTFSPNTLKSQRDWMLKRLMGGKNETYPVKVFLPRRSKYRNLLNVEQVCEYVSKRDIEILEPNEAFFLKQHLYFSMANLIVSPGGATLANILFMQPGSKVIVVQSSRNANLGLWKKLAGACQVNYSEIVGIPTYYGFNSLAREHSNFYAPLGRFKKAMKI
jgi:capsular polysaccharide biosynthesis protein